MSDVVVSSSKLCSRRRRGGRAPLRSPHIERATGRVTSPLVGEGGGLGDFFLFSSFLRCVDSGALRRVSVQGRYADYVGRCRTWWLRPLRLRHLRTSAPGVVSNPSGRRHTRTRGCHGYFQAHGILLRWVSHWVDSRRAFCEPRDCGIHLRPRGRGEFRHLSSRRRAFGLACSYVLGVSTSRDLLTKSGR